MELNLVKLVIEVRPEFFSLLAPLVSGKGAAFEEAIRHVCCTQGNASCHRCSFFPFCPAIILTAKELSLNPDMVRRHQKPALPYVFKRMDLQKSEKAAIGLTLFGPACSHLSTVLAAVDQMVAGKHCFNSIAALDYQDTVVPFDLTDLSGISTMPVLAASELLAQHGHRFTNCKRVQLLLQTPVRIVKEMRELNRFEPVIFCRSILRRISSLAAYYGDAGINYDLFRYLIECSQDIRLVKVSDCCKSEFSSLRGVSGCYELLGPFDELGPFLYLGSLMHVGKRSSYGMGAFDITPIP